MDEPVQVLPPVDAGGWEINQLAKVHAPDIPLVNNSFTGSIGNVEIKLGRIPGDSLIFIISNVGQGSAQLKVTMGNQIRTWDVVLEYWPYYVDQQTLLPSFLQKCRDLKAKILKVEKLKELEEPFGQWIEFFYQKSAVLLSKEKEYLAGTFKTVRQEWRLIILMNLLNWNASMEQFRL